MKKLLISVLSLGLVFSIVIGFSSCNKVVTLDSNYQYKQLDNATIKYTGFYENLMNHTKNTQLLNKDMWKQFVDVFRTKEDSEKNRWKCEYWGKTMRGAVLCYKYDQSDELYNVLEETVRDLLTAQDSDGAFTTYEKNNEFNGWDMWGRKYVMTSLLGFLDICKDNNLKNDITNALKRHADYIINHVGKDKIDITHTSVNWLGVNSASILEPIVNLYEVTGDNKYIDFAQYIVETGGIRTENGNLIDICLNTSRLPYQYPEAKAYETMSFFEGVYRYALIKNDTVLKQAALKFFDDVETSEISVTGNAGYDEEQFNHGAITQTIEPDRFGQETCVAVTWMRIQDLLYKTTGKIKYYENLKKSGLNAFLGCVNYYKEGAHDIENAGPDPLAYLPFDSYSPLGGGQRGVACGGFLYFNQPLNPNFKYYGCCACISSAAVGLMSLDTVVANDKTVRLNDYYSGTIDSNDGKFDIEGNLLINDDLKINVDSSSDKNLELLIPSWIASKSKLVVDGEVVTALPGTYSDCGKKLKDIKEISIKFTHKINKTEINDKVSLSYGDLVLGIDTEANPGLDLHSVNINDINIKNYTLEQIQEDDLVRISVPYKGHKLVFKSYASCGKHWQTKNSHVTVFVNNK